MSLKFSCVFIITSTTIFENSKKYRIASVRYVSIVIYNFFNELQILISRWPR